MNLSFALSYKNIYLTILTNTKIRYMIRKIGIVPTIKGKLHQSLLKTKK